MHTPPPKPGPGSTHETWELRFPGGQCHRHQLLRGGTSAWHGPVAHAYHFSPATAEDAYTQQCHWRVPVPGTHPQTATLHVALMRVEMLLEEINLRPEEKAFLRQKSASAELQATASQAELLPRLHLQKANKQNCLRSENTASSLRDTLSAFLARKADGTKLRVPLCQSLSAPLEMTPGRLEAVQAPVRVFTTPQKAAAWITCGIRHRHPRELNHQPSETGCSRSPAWEPRG